MGDPNSIQRRPVHTAPLPTQPVRTQNAVSGTVAGQTGGTRPNNTPPAGQTAGTTLPTNSSVNINVSTAETPLTQPDLTFGRPTGATGPAGAQGVSAEGTQQLQQYFSEIDGDMGSFFQAVAENRTPLPEIDMRKGQNYAVARIFSTQDPATVRNMGAALDFAAKALATPPAPGYSLAAMPAEMKASLQRMGLMIFQGKIFNAVTKEEVGLGQLNALSRLAAHQSIANGPAVLRETPGETALRSLSGPLQRATVALRSMSAVQAELQNVNQVMRDLQAAAADKENELLEQKAKTEASRLKRDATQQELDQATELTQGLKTQGADFLQNPATLNKLNALLRSRGIQGTRGSNGELSFRDSSGAAIDTSRVLAELETIETQRRQALDADNAALQQDIDRLATIDSEAAQIEHDLSFATEQARNLADENDRQMEEARTVHQPAIDAALQDPNLSPEKRAELEGLRDGFTEALAKGERLSAETRAEIAKSEQALAALRGAREQARQTIASAGAPAASGVLTPQQLLAAELRDKSDALRAKANELEATLNLAPRPAHVDVEKMVNQWRAILEEYAAKFKELEKGQSDTRAIAGEFAKHNAKQMRSQAEYHSNQLKNLDMRNLERVEAALREALQAVR